MFVLPRRKEGRRGGENEETEASEERVVLLSRMRNEIETIMLIEQLY